MPINHRTRQDIISGVRLFLARLQAQLDADIDRNQIDICDQDCEAEYAAEVVDTVRCEIEGAFAAEDPE